MEIGQVVYLKPIEMSNAYRQSKSVREATVEKIGKKYVTVSRYGQFDIKSGLEKKTNYSPDYELFESKEDIDLLMESEDLQGRIKNAIPKYGKWDLDIEKLRQIATILNC